jgi:hypothetical protein
MKAISSTDITIAVLWAQRSSSSDAAKNFVYLTISVPDIPKDDIKLDLKPQGLSFTGTSGTLKRKYHVDLEFYAEIDPAESKINHTSKNIEMKLQKKELSEEYWPRLLKDSKKLHFLKTDFDKWVDEDEQDEAPEEDFSQFGGMGKCLASFSLQKSDKTDTDMHFFLGTGFELTSLPQVVACPAWEEQAATLAALTSPSSVAALACPT